MHTIHYNLAIKGNELLRHTITWVLRERSQTEKNASWMIPFIQTFLKDKLIHRNRKQISGCLGTERELKRGVGKGT